MSAPRPLPLLSPESEPFWRAAREGRLVIQHCPRSGRFQHPPRPYLSGCGFEWEWRELPGTGALYSFTVVHPPADPYFEIPYAAGVVEMDGAGVRIAGTIREVEHAALRIGMRLRIRFDRVGEIGIPYFVPE